MRVPTVKLVDEYAGRAATGVLRRFTTVHPPSPVERILCIKFWGLGSIVLASGAIRSIRAAFPNARLDILTLEANAQVCAHLGLFDRVHTVRITRWDRFARDAVAAVRALAADRYDTVVDLELFAYVSALAALGTRAPRRLGFAKGAAPLFTSTVPFDSYRHVTASFRALAAELTGKPSNDPVSLDVAAADAERVASILATHGVGPESVVVAMNVNASALARERRWPREQFARIAARLSATFGAQVVLIGSAAERDYTDGLVRELPRPAAVTNLAGRLTFGELVALVDRSEVLVTNDSGPLHVASALDVPTIALFGPETPVRYGPLATEQLTLYAGLACSPCMSVENRKTVNCRYDALCMRSIGADSAWERIEPFVRRVLANADRREAIG